MRRIAALPFNAANPMWLAGRADLDYHVRRTVLAEPGSQHQLEQCVADLHTPLLDRERPLWELHVIEGLEGGRVALYVKIHHAGLDGASAQLFLRSFVDVAARPPKRSTRPPRLPQVEHASTADLLLAGFRHQAAGLGRLSRLVVGLAGQLPVTFRGARDALLKLAPGGPSSAPRTPLNVVISGERSFASVECDLAQVKSIARIHSATVNDVILAAGAGALRRWLILHDQLPAASLRTAVPFSTRKPGNVDQSIQVSFMTIDLHTDIEEPQTRLRAIHASSVEAKAAAERVRALMPEDLPSIGLPWLLGGLARVLGSDGVLSRLPLPFNLIISNVAGPPTPLYVAGARALTYAPVSIPYHGCALNITVYSYDGKLFFGLTGARSALPDLGDLAEGMTLEINRLTRRRRTARAR